MQTLRFSAYSSVDEKQPTCSFFPPGSYPFLMHKTSTAWLYTYNLICFIFRTFLTKIFALLQLPEYLPVFDHSPENMENKVTALQVGWHIHLFD